MTSKHLTNDRQGRMALIAKISTTGIITVRNVRSRKVVTYLIARPGQLKRFFTDAIPEYLVEIAREHQRLGYNMA